MNRYFTKKVKLILFGISLFGLTSVSLISFTDASHLEKVTLNNNEISNWDENYGLNPQGSILSQPLDSLASVLINKNSIFKVDISYSMFNKIDIKTNNFEPVCFMLDRFSKNIYGVTKQSRIIKLENCNFNWDNPILTSVTFGKLYDYCFDKRVSVIIPQLIKLKKDNPDLYRLVEEIDFGNKRFLKVAISGLNYRLKIKTESLRVGLDKFVEFVSRFEPDLDNVNLIDLRFDNMIITQKA
jgi:hypothetical protein